MKLFMKDVNLNEGCDMTKVLDALQLADGLMTDDPKKFKRGYTRANAEIAAIESLGLSQPEIASFKRIMIAKYGVEPQS